MQNPNTKPVLTLAEKCAVLQINGVLCVPMVVRSYDEEIDIFYIAADSRYECDPDVDGLNCDTSFYDVDDFTVPAVAIHALTGSDCNHADPHAWFGHRFIMPVAPTAW